MKSFRILLRVAMVVVIVSLVLPACDMPWDDDDDKKSPLDPILGNYDFSGLSKVRFDYEEEFTPRYEGEEGVVGVEDSAWSTWRDAFNPPLPALIDLAYDEKGYYKVFLEITKNQWEVYITQIDEDNVQHFIWGIRGTHQLEKDSGDQWTGQATHTHKWSISKGDWDIQTGSFDMKIWIEAETWLRFEYKGQVEPMYTDPIKNMFVDGDVPDAIQFGL
jgi:hypothetical protein